MGFKTVLAGANVLAVDMTAAAVMGFVPEEIEHIRMAAEHGLGPAGLRGNTGGWGAGGGHQAEISARGSHHAGLGPGQDHQLPGVQRLYGGRGYRHQPPDGHGLF